MLVEGDRDDNPYTAEQMRNEEMGEDLNQNAVKLTHGASFEMSLIPNRTL